MSLYRQLWIAIALLMLVVFGATFLINGISSSRYLSEQLSIKNSDGASALALSLSQQELDPVSLELQLTAQLDQGAYARISFRRPDGTVVFDRSRDFDTRHAPGWLKGLLPIESLPGQAEVSNGWTRLGTLTLQSHEGFAYDELWAMGQRTLVALLAAIMVAGGLGSLLLRVILRPLDRVVLQAEAMGQRRFEKHPEPRTRELATVTRAMNSLTERMQRMLQTEADRLSDQRRRLDADPVTGLLSREPFLERLHATLEREGLEAEGSIALLRLGGLLDLNQRYGRETIDAALRDVGSSLKSWSDALPALVAGRLNGSDFAVFAPEDDEPQRLGDALRQRLAEVLSAHALMDDASLPSACGHYSQGEQPGPLLGRLDQAMALDSGDPRAPVSELSIGVATGASLREQTATWQLRLRSALQAQSLFLEYFPVQTPTGRLLQREGMLRLEDGGQFAGGTILPWAHRLGMTGEIDRTVVQLGLKRAEAGEEPICVNLSSAALTDADFADWLARTLDSSGEAASLLRLDIGEAAAFNHARRFDQLRAAAHDAGSQLGIEHMGYRLGDLGLVASLGPDYLKIDSAFVRGIDISGARRALLTTYASIARSLDIPCIAEGVASDAERAAAIDCGVTGVTGPAI
jgi:predicted signal transduction protein with EAL and GGDEF domain